MFIDSHAHMSSQTQDLDAELIRAKEAKIAVIMNICTDLSSLEKGLLLALQTKDPQFYNIAATTPHDVEKDGEHFFPIVEKAATEQKLVAIGETGLDYYYEHAPRELQQLYLRQYLKLANRLQLPVVIHCRDAWDDFFSILDEENEAQSTKTRGVLHCFTGTVADAKKVLDRGFYVSFSGIVTFPKSTVLKEAAKYVPQDRLFIETDSPYLAPQPFRGKKNEPAYVVEVAKVVAELKGISLETLATSTTKNVVSLFNLQL